MGFIDVIITPMMEVIKTFLPEFEKQPLALLKNKKKYDNLIPSYDEELCIN